MTRKSVVLSASRVKSLVRRAKARLALRVQATKGPADVNTRDALTRTGTNAVDEVEREGAGQAKAGARVVGQTGTDAGQQVRGQAG